MVLSGAWGDKYDYFLTQKDSSPWSWVRGVTAEPPADRFRGGGRDQSEGHRDHACVERGSHGKAIADLSPGDVRSHK